jgi:deazaflavin-dependent oxidoreductase (nitroreductase family)
MADPHYARPDWMTRVFNQLPFFLARFGIAFFGSRILAVRGRKSGTWRTTPVNVLMHGGVRYLIAPRGETEWVRNLRAAGGGELRLGSKAEAVRASELDDAAKPVLIRAYLGRWGWQVKPFFPGLDARSNDDTLLAAAPRYPTFRID